MEKLISLLLLVTGALLSATAHAGVSRCEGCTEAQFRQRAIDLGVGRHIISSLSTDRIGMYDVTHGKDSHPSSPDQDRTATPVAMPPELTDAFDAAHDFYVLTAGSNEIVVEVDGRNLGVRGLDMATAHDVMTDYNLRSMLGDRLSKGELPLVSEVVNKLIEQMPNGLAFIGVGDVSIEFVVSGADGSTVTYRQESGTWPADYSKGQSRTRDGRLIPEWSPVAL